MIQTQPATSTPSRLTLAQLNASIDPRPRTWDRYSLALSYAVGKVGRQRSGEHYHLLLVETVTAEQGEHKPGTIKVGERFSVHGSCNRNGQHTGSVVPGIDTDAITCKSCLMALESLARTRAAVLSAMEIADPKPAPEAVAPLPTSPAMTARLDGYIAGLITAYWLSMDQTSRTNIEGELVYVCAKYGRPQIDLSKTRLSAHL